MAPSVPWPVGHVKGPFGGAALKELKGRVMKITPREARSLAGSKYRKGKDPVRGEAVCPQVRLSTAQGVPLVRKTGLLLHPRSLRAAMSKANNCAIYVDIMRILWYFSLKGGAIMAKVSTNISLDADLKKESQELLSELGLDLSTAVTIFLKQMVREQGIPFRITLDQPPAATASALAEYDEMQKHPEKYKRYPTFRAALDEVLTDA